MARRGQQEEKAEATAAAAGREERRAEYAGQGPQSGQRRPESDAGSGHVPPDCTAPGGCRGTEDPAAPLTRRPPRAASGHRGERGGETAGTKSLWEEGEL